MRRESHEVKPRSRTVIELDIAGLIINSMTIMSMIISMMMIIMIILMMIKVVQCLL